MIRPARTERLASAAPMCVIMGERVGEMSLLTATSHSVTATATACTNVTTAVLRHAPMPELIRLHPDIQVHGYRELVIDQ